MMNCKRATRLMSQELDRPLTLRERTSLRMHVMMCDGCSNFRKQMAYLRDIARRWGNK
jgi:hypothetical protein